MADMCPTCINDFLIFFNLLKDKTNHHFIHNKKKTNNTIKKILLEPVHKKLNLKGKKVF
jgi:hypothetical protein